MTITKKHLGLLTLNKDGYFTEIKYPMFIGRQIISLFVEDDTIKLVEKTVTFETNEFADGVALALGIFKDNNLQSKPLVLIKLGSKNGRV
jgi:hypothetical protein